MESASPDIQYEGTFWIHTKVVNNAQDFRAIKYGGASNQVASSNPPYDPQITSNQGVSSNQPYNSQFIKETPRRGTTYLQSGCKCDLAYGFIRLAHLYQRKGLHDRAIAFLNKMNKHLGV